MVGAITARFEAPALPLAAKQPTLPRGMTRFAVLTWWAVSLVTTAHASDLDLQWRAPAQACPDRDQLRLGLSQRLQRSVSLGADAPLHVDAEVRAEAVGYVLTLHTRAGADEERRVLRARTCNELARASVLIAALLFARATPGTTRARQPMMGARPHGYAHPQVVADLGTLPGPSVGAGVSLGLALGAVTLELGGSALLPRTGSEPPARASLQLITAAAKGCIELARAGLLSGCIQLELGVLRATGRDQAGAFASQLFWVMPVASGRLAIALTPRLQWLTEIGVGMPWDRARFVFQHGASVHRIPSVVGRLSTGLGVRF